MVTRWGLRGRRGPPIAGTPADWLDREAALHRADLDRRIDAALVASTGGHPARTGASARRARRWLAALARVPHADLTWWRIAEAVPRPVRVAAESLVLVVGVGLAIGAGFLISPVLGLGAGFAVSMHGGIPTGMPPQPHRASGWLRRLAGHGWLPAVVGLVYGAAFPPLLAPS
ncbi:MAG TPA: hypothetical protein VFT95_23365, partial [Micromonosporaceae bacterium]|nr:hypothetical protein [Micromonosporaceae bacterium]